MLVNFDWIEIAPFFILVIIAVYHSAKRYNQDYHQPKFPSLFIAFLRILLTFAIILGGYLAGFLLKRVFDSKIVIIIVFGFTIIIEIYTIKRFDKFINNVLSQ